MGRALGHTALSVDLSERTLRRYVNEGLLRARRVGDQVELTHAERRYLHSHHDLLKELRATLRTERNVRLAVLFGSAATGEDVEASDVDLIVGLRQGDVRALAALRRRLQTALGRRVHLVLLGDAKKAPALLADVLEEGRVVIDRESSWPALLADRRLVEDRAARADAELMRKAGAAISAARRRVVA